MIHRGRDIPQVVLQHTHFPAQGSHLQDAVRDNPLGDSSDNSDCLLQPAGTQQVPYQQQSEQASARAAQAQSVARAGNQDNQRRLQLKVQRLVQGKVDETALRTPDLWWPPSDHAGQDIH